MSRNEAKVSAGSSESSVKRDRRRSSWCTISRSKRGRVDRSAAGEPATKLSREGDPRRRRRRRRRRERARPRCRSRLTATRLGANDVTVRVRPPPGEFAVGVPRCARELRLRAFPTLRDATRRNATLGSAAIAGDGSGSGRSSGSGDGSGDRAVVAVSVVCVRSAVWWFAPRRAVPCRASRWGQGYPVESAARGRPITLFYVCRSSAGND